MYLIIFYNNLRIIQSSESLFMQFAQIQNSFRKKKSFESECSLHLICAHYFIVKPSIGNCIQIIYSNIKLF